MSYNKANVDDDDDDCTVKAKKANRNLQQRTLSGFITIPLY